MFNNSPLEFLAQLYDNRIYVKREDKLSYSFGGNKVRFAKAFLSDMRAKGKNAMIAYGSKSSNLCRVVAQLCHDNAVPCAVIYSEDDHSDTNNSRIVNALGVREYSCKKTEVADTVQRAISDFISDGYDPYYIYGSTLGKGNEMTPVKSYTRVYDEILDYERKSSIRFDYIFLAVGTAATYSGLVCRAAELSHNRSIIGISVARPKTRCVEIIGENLRLYLGKDCDFPINVSDSFLFGGYGNTSAQELEEIDFIFDRFALPLDPTYTGKAFYGMKSTLEEMNIKDKNILFIHTGGYPLFCDYKGINL